jgi:MoxR-like ATPase
MTATAPAQNDAALIAELRRIHAAISAEVGKVIVGQTEVIDQLLIAILARGHCLLEGVPGLAKTAMVKALADAMNLSFRRIQFTPDLMPSDITGTEIIQDDPETRQRNLVFQQGPIFAQMILADEINRTPPKTQAALLEAMQERTVTVGGRTLPLDQPFFVLATQNPIEQEGTYPLPEAQRDRFMFHVLVRYPDRDQEREIINRTTGGSEDHPLTAADAATIISCQQVVRRVPVPEHVTERVLDLVRATRPDDPSSPALVRDLVAWGAGPRACQTLILAGKVRALLEGRLHVTIEDISAMAHPVLRHRIKPTFSAEAEGLSVDTIIDRILAALPVRDPVQAL